MKKNQTIFEMFHEHYTQQPWFVTINNLYQEIPIIYPFPTENFIVASFKSWILAAISAFATPFGYNPGDLRKDSTYSGQFIQNGVSAGKNTVLSLAGIKRGTKKNDIQRPLADVAKGLCKMWLLSFPTLRNNVFASNTMCEIPAWAYLNGLDRIKDAGKDLLDYNAWLEAMNNTPFWADTLRKSVAQVISAKLTQEYVLQPSLGIFKHVYKILPESFKNFLEHDFLLKDIPGITSTAAIFYTPLVPSIATIIREIYTGTIIVPIVRMSTYTINGRIKVISEFDGKLSCDTIGSVFEQVQNNNLTIEYKYDASKPKNITGQESLFICENVIISNELLSHHADHIIVHYPKEDNLVGKITNYIGEMSEYFFPSTDSTDL
ncbi:MAG: hypothetical protein AABY27_00940 [Pseudomonadota bacterium]